MLHIKIQFPAASCGELNPPCGINHGQGKTTLQPLDSLYRNRLNENLQK